MTVLNKNSWLITFVVFGVTLSADFLNRLSITPVDGRQRNNDAALVLNNHQKVTDEELAKVLAMFEIYDKKEIKQLVIAPKAKKIGMSEQEQEKQNGKLTRFYIGDLRFVLKGIFTEGERFAVLYRENINSGQIDEIKVVQEQSIGAYRITKISDKKIYFTLDERVIELAIF